MVEIKKLNATAIGVFTDSEEEAEKAVEKLKAWKRLKDKGFQFKGWTDNSDDIFSSWVVRCDFGKIEVWKDEQATKDLDLLFGGEE